MRMTRGRLFAGAALMFVSALALPRCTSKPPSAASESAPPPAPALTPVLSVHELMEHFIDPTADWIFDAAVVDVNEKGTVETKPVSDDDWLKVERGLMQLAEATNLLKMTRPMAPAAAEGSSNEQGASRGELSHAEIQAKVDQDRPRWNKYADDLRVVAVDSLKTVRAKDAEGLFQVGSDIDRACEGCHLEYWYPGDREAVLADQKKRVTIDPPKK